MAGPAAAVAIFHPLGLSYPGLIVKESCWCWTQRHLAGNSIVTLENLLRWGEFAPSATLAQLHL